MATRVANADGNFGTAGTWDQAANTPTIHASTNVTIGTGSTSVTGTFTAPNTSNSATGVLVYLTNKAFSGTPTTLTAVLQEASVDTACTVTITLADVNANTWIYFRVPTPYTYTATTANRYRWRFYTDSGTVSVAADSGGTNRAFISTDDRHTVPSDGEQTFISGLNGNSTTVTVTMDGTQACGADPATGVPSSNTRSVSNGLILSNGGILQGDQTANHQLTVKGYLQVDAGGQFIDGTTGSPLSSSYTATYIFTASAAGSPGISVFDYGKFTAQGTPKSSTSLWKTTYSSGAGTAADPLITADAVDWIVGDEILIAASSANATNYNETESRFIITKNSATSYVLSSTSGGSETALTYTHTNARIVNVGQNIIFKGTSTSITAGMMFNSQTDTGNIDIDWVRFQNVGGGLFFGVAPTTYVSIGKNVNIDYSCLYNHFAVGWYIGIPNTSDTTTRSYTGLVAYNTLTQASSNTYGSFVGGSISNATLNDCIVMCNQYMGFNMSSSYSNSLNRCEAYATNVSNTTSHGGFNMTGSGVVALTDCQAHANRGSGIVFNTAPNITIGTSLFGTKGANQTADILGVSSSFNTAIFDSCSFGSSTLISNYLNQAAGSEIKFNRYQATDNNHRWYTIYGYATSEDTVIRSPGLSVKMIPENLTTGFTWQFQVPVVQNSIAGFRGYFLKNSTLGTGVVTISMYLPGNPVSGGVPDASATLDNTTGSAFNDTDEQSVAITAEYTGDIPGAAEILVNVKSNTAGAYLYADDFYNAGDRTTTFDSITGLNLWVDGKPLSVISPSVPSADDTAAAVWGYLLAQNQTTGTASKYLKNAADDAELAAIK